MTSARHELAGLTHQGAYDRPLDASGWVVPTVALDTDRLAWDLYGDGMHSEVRAHAKPRMLKRFLGLAGASDAKVLEYAQEFGVLTASTHDWPATAGVEPVAWWRSLALEAGAVLDVGATIRTPRTSVQEADWDRFTTMSVAPVDRGIWDFDFHDEGPFRSGLLGGVGDPKDILAAYVRRWLSDVRVGVTWTARRPASMYLSPSGLLGALGLQLAQALAGTTALAFACRSCGRSFAPEKSANQRYCGPCRELNEPQRRATEAYRRRRRQA